MKEKAKFENKSLKFKNLTGIFFYVRVYKVDFSLRTNI